MVIKILFILFGAFLFLFLYWRRLKEDYISSMIFSSFFCLLLGVVLFVFLANQFFPIWWFWSAVLGLSLGLAATLFRFKFRFFETLEAVTISGLSWLSLVFLGDALANQSWFSLAGFALLLGLILFFFFLDSRYKKFTWYKSGRVGFTGLISLGSHFLLRGVVAIFFPFVLSFSGKYEPLISGMSALVFFLTVFYLSRKII